MSQPSQQQAVDDVMKHAEGDLNIRSVLECGQDVTRCQFNKEGTLLAVGLSDGNIKLFSLDSGSVVRVLRDAQYSAMPVTGLRFTYSSQSHCLLLATYASGAVRCWYTWGGDILWSQMEVGEAAGEVEEANRQTLCLDVSCSGERAATGGSDASLFLYDLQTQQRVLTCTASVFRTVMDGHRSRVFAVTFHPERESEFISGGWDNTVQFWDSRQQQSVRRISGPHICGEAIHIDPDQNQILTGSWTAENQLQVWDYMSGNKVYDIPQETAEDTKVYACKWLGQRHLVAGGSQSNMLRLINRHNMKTEGRLTGLSSAVCCLSPCPQTGLLAAASGHSVFLLERQTA